MLAGSGGLGWTFWRLCSEAQPLTFSAAEVELPNGGMVLTDVFM